MYQLAKYTKWVCEIPVMNESVTTIIYLFIMPANNTIQYNTH